MGEFPIVVSNGSADSQVNPQGLAAVVFRNIGANLARVAVVSAVAILLPPYLTHHLSVKEYAAWVLIIQLGAYVMQAQDSHSCFWPASLAVRSL
jgi:hypothetical protein